MTRAGPCLVALAWSHSPCLVRVRVAYAHRRRSRRDDAMRTYARGLESSSRRLQALPCPSSKHLGVICKGTRGGHC